MKKQAGCLLFCILAACAFSASAGSVVVSLSDSAGSPVADAVASLHPLDSATPALTPGTAVMDQRGLKFVPQVLPVVVGTKVDFPNSDHVRHHVYSFSPAKRFELRLYAAHHAKPEEFDTPGVVVLGCNIHDWMLGYIYVLDTPYFAKSGGQGRIHLKDIPAGRYELRVWHPRLPTDTPILSEEIQVPADGTVDRRYTLSLHAPDQTNEPPPKLGLDALGEGDGT